MDGAGHRNRTCLPEMKWKEPLKRTTALAKPSGRPWAICILLLQLSYLAQERKQCISAHLPAVSVLKHEIYTDICDIKPPHRDR